MYLSFVIIPLEFNNSKVCFTTCLSYHRHTRPLQESLILLVHMLLKRGFPSASFTAITVSINFLPRLTEGITSYLLPCFSYVARRLSPPCNQTSQRCVRWPTGNSLCSSACSKTFYSNQAAVW